MSKQLTLSATAAVLAMAAFVFAAGFGNVTNGAPDQLAGNTPLAGFAATR